MITFTPNTPLEAAVLESGRFEFATDTAGREVLLIGHRRLHKVVMGEKAEGIHDLMQAVASSGARAFHVSEGDPWQIDEDEPDGGNAPEAAEEYLVMGLRPLTADRRPVRVVANRKVVRLFLLPWIIPARTVGFGGDAHFVVTSARGVVGDWEAAPDGRHGVVVGVPEMWAGLFERYRRPDSELVFRCDVPVPWVGDSGLANAVPKVVGVFDSAGGTDAAGAAAGNGSSGVAVDGASDAGPGEDESWVASIPVVMIEGDVVQPVPVPEDVEVGGVPDGLWEIEAQGSAEFSVSSLT